MTDAYIHIGTHKTGSTTIQHALRDISRAHPEEGWIFAGTTATAKSMMQPHRYDKRLVRQFGAEFERLVRRARAARAKRVILSSEALSGSPDDGYLNSKGVFAMLRDATRRYHVKVIIFLRRQDSFVESMYTQKIHEGGTLEFENFLHQYDSPDSLDYRRILDDLSSSFGEQALVVRSYHESARAGLLADFGEIIGSESLRCAEEAARNPSYSRHALEIARLCNRSLDTTGQRRLRHALQTTMPKGASEPFSYFPDDERAAFLSRYEVSNRDVAQRYFDGDIMRLFPPPRPAQPTSANEGVQYDEVAGLVVALLNGDSRDKRRMVLARIRGAILDHPRLRRLISRVRRRT